LRAKLSKAEFARVDICGVFLLLASSVLLVFALEEGGNRYPWDSGAIIVPLVVAIIAAVVLAGWEVFLEKRGLFRNQCFLLAFSRTGCWQPCRCKLRLDSN
jgi:hypothetical protein